MRAREILDKIPDEVMNATDRINAGNARPLDAQVVAQTMRRVFTALVTQLHEEVNGLEDAQRRAAEARRRSLGG